MFLARKITQAKWRPKEGFAEGEIAADAVTVDLKTQNNSLSFWRCPTETTEDLEKAVLAIAATRNRVEKLEIVWLTDDDLRNDCQTLTNTEGETPVSELTGLHVDVCLLDYVRLGKIASRIAIALKKCRWRRISKGRVKMLLVEAVEQKRVELADLQESIQGEVRKSLEARK